MVFLKYIMLLLVIMPVAFWLLLTQSQKELIGDVMAYAPLILISFFASMIIVTVARLMIQSIYQKFETRKGEKNAA